MGSGGDKGSWRGCRDTDMEEKWRQGRERTDMGERRGTIIEGMRNTGMERMGGLGHIGTATRRGE